MVPEFIHEILVFRKITKLVAEYSFSKESMNKLCDHVKWLHNHAKSCKILLLLNKKSRQFLQSAEFPQYTPLAKCTAILLTIHCKTLLNSPSRYSKKAESR